ncbi:hypothetical protein [Actinomadura gamaensis]|uniref:Uncharacterized protein n=1 Tax=Actinomadura gamaensis TaxID=1763541 RepID=A0ABV9U7P2_9ACTN
MPRIRAIKPGFFASEDVAALPLRARLTWIGLWTHCDDQGRAKDNVKLIKAALWPLDPVSLQDVEDDLAVLAEHGRILRYEVAGRRFLAVVGWHEHQKISKPTTSKLPPPPTTDSCPPARATPKSNTESNDPPVDNPGDSYPQGASEPLPEPDNREESTSGSPPGTLPESSRTAPVGKGKERKGKERISPRARAHNAARWLRDRYRLTDHEASQVLEAVQARAPRPIDHLVPYLTAMAEGDLADIVAAVMDTPPPGHTPAAGVPDDELPPPYEPPPVRNGLLDREPGPDQDDITSRGATAVRQALAAARTNDPKDEP